MKDLMKDLISLISVYWETFINIQLHFVIHIVMIQHNEWPKGPCYVLCDMLIINDDFNAPSSVISWETFVDSQLHFVNHFPLIHPKESPKGPCLLPLDTLIIIVDTR